MANYRFTLISCLLFLLMTNLSAWAGGLPANFLYLKPDEQIRLLDLANKDHDARMAQHDSASSALYAEGLTLLRIGQLEDGLSKLEQAIVTAVPDMSTRYPLGFKDLTHRYVGVAFALHGVKRPIRFFRDLANRYPDNPLVQATFAFNSLRMEGIQTMGNGLRMIDKALQKDPENRFARVAKALALSWLPFGFHAADREWERLLNDASIPPEYTRLFLTFRRIMYKLHGHEEKASAIPQYVPKGNLSAKLTTVLGNESLDDYQSFQRLRGLGRKTKALDHIERALRREIDKPGFALLFGKYLIALERDNQRGAQFFDDLVTTNPSSPHALAASGFYTQIVFGADVLLQGLDIIQEARTQALQQPETLFVFDLFKVMLSAAIPGRYAAALEDFEQLAPDYREQVPHVPRVVEGHERAIRQVHGLLPSSLWSKYDPWKTYVDEKDERKRASLLYIEPTFEFDVPL